jgi:regulator of replication initiation timing
MLNISTTLSQVNHSMHEGLDPNPLQDVVGAQQAIVQLLNWVEALASDNRELREENQHLRDEINRLKGEQGKPQIQPNRVASPPTATNHSSERERHKGQARKKSRQFAGLHISEGGGLEPADPRPGRVPRRKRGGVCGGLRSSPWQHIDETSTRVMA